MRRIIFLDIDGVVLPLSQPARRRFEDYAPQQLPLPLQLLVTLLDEYPNIELVLSSSWRIDFGIERARQLLPIRHQKRLIDQTPVIGTSADRGAECLQWLRQQTEECLFVALDDCQQLFGKEIDWLIKVDIRRGITEDSLLKLKQQLHLPVNN